MRVWLLGPMQVETQSGPVTIAAAKERAVLARLALDVGRPVASAEIVDALWGDDPPPSALKTAQSYVARLRRVLPSDWIVSHGSAYTLALTTGDVDAARFEAAVARARAAALAGDDTTVADLLATALALWSGPAVPDLAETPTGEAVAARLHDLRRSAEENLADARLALGGGAELVADLAAAAREQPLREHRWVQLMIALYRADRQGDALRAYQEARTALVEGLGIEPGDALRATERAVLGRDASLLATRPGVADNLPAALDAITAPRMAGRHAELDAISERWSEVRGGARRAVVIRGEPGIGKTRLAGEAALVSHHDGALVLFGRCDRDGLTPYQVLVDALRPHGLGQRVPELGDATTPDKGAEGDERGGRRRLFDAVASFVDDRAGARAIVLLLDDLQWADRETTALLRHLLRSVRAPLLLLGTFRSEADADPHAAQLVADLPPETAPVMLDLHGLDRDAVGELIGDAAEVAAAIHDSTGGSPLFVTELLRFRDATGRFPQGDEVPLGVRQAVARRVADLPGHARRLLDAAAVAGEGVAIEEVASVAGLTELDAVDVVDRAIATHVLVDHGTDAIVFSHDLVRSALLHEMSEARRAYLHRRVAEAILAVTSGAPRSRAAAVAHHLAAATAAPDPEVARWATAAADDALARYAWEAAAAQLTLALDHLGDEATPRRLELLLRLAETHRTSGMETPARERFTEAVQLARLDPDPTVYRSAVVRWTLVAVDIRKELHSVIELLRDALAATPADGSADQAQLMGRLAFSLAWAGDPDARPMADAAIATARGAGVPRTLARTLLYAMPSRDQFEAHDPAGIVGELLNLIPSLDDPDFEGQILSAATIGHLQRGNRAAADEALAALHRIADRYRLVSASFYATRLDGYVALGDDKVDDADRIASELLTAATHTDLPNLFLIASSLLYDVRRAQGRLAELLPWFERRQNAGERIPRIAAMRAEVLTAAGRADDALTALNELRQDNYAAITPAERIHSFATLAEVAARLGATDACTELAALLGPWSGLTVFDSSNGPLEPVDDYLRRLESVVETPTARPRYGR